MDLLSLPNEILFHVLSNDEITIADLGSLILCCKRLMNLIRDSNELWKRKFSARWPRLSHLQAQQHTQWLAVTHQRISTAARVARELGAMSALCYPEGEPPTGLMDTLTSNDTSGFVEDELLEIVFHSNKDEWLTHKYYGCKVLRYLRTRRLVAKWREFLQRPTAQQSLLEGAVLISQWGQMDQERLPSLGEVTNAIEGIVERVRQLLSISTLKPSPKKILSFVNQVLYEEMGLHGNTHDYHSFNNSYIDKVLETRKGIPITLCILYLEVANRLGVRCEPVSFPHHFLLRWKEFPERKEEDSFTYVDAFNGGAAHLPGSCPALIGQPRQNINREAYAAVDPVHVFQRMVNNLTQCSRVQWDHGRGDQNGLRNQLHFYRLACTVTPGQTQSIVAYAELCVFLGVQLEEAMQLLQSEGGQDDQPDPDGMQSHLSRVRQITYEKCANKLSYQQAVSSKRTECSRPGSVKYAVGMVMRHLRYNYTCVIAFWDSRCKASDEWMDRMGIRNLVRGMDQPFYHVLVDDGSSRYAAEENLEIALSPTTVDHPDVGLHFDRFDGRRYVPNAEKRAHFPEDEEAAIQALLLN